MHNNGEVDFSRSTLFTVSTCASTICNYTLSFGLSAGLYRVLAYDTDQYGTLPSGTGYPAARQEFETSGNTQGIFYNDNYMYCIILPWIFSYRKIQSIHASMFP